MRCKAGQYWTHASAIWHRLGSSPANVAQHCTQLVLSMPASYSPSIEDLAIVRQPHTCTACRQCTQPLANYKRQLQGTNEL